MDDESLDTDATAPSGTEPHLIPHRLKRLRVQSVRAFRQVAGGVVPRTCPICDYQGLFAAFGTPPRLDAICPSCSSLERHRMLRLLLSRQPLIGPSDRILHFAPEPSVTRILREVSSRYETADLARRNVDHQLNIEAIALPDDSFDRIVCFQVLEHVDDTHALAEMFRILTPGGIALLNIPIIEGWDRTYENPEIVSPEDRFLHFGQSDHVRFFGRDVRERMKRAGFELTEFVAEEPDVGTYGLYRGERIFIARKPEGAPS